MREDQEFRSPRHQPDTGRGLDGPCEVGEPHVQESFHDGRLIAHGEGRSGEARAPRRTGSIRVTPRP